MADIIHEFIVRAKLERVFESFATPHGLEKWWTKSSSCEGGEKGAQCGCISVLNTTGERK